MRVVSLSLVSMGMVIAGSRQTAAQSSSRTESISPAVKSGSPTADAAVAIRLGTLGLGFEVGKQLMDHLSARIGLNFGSLNKDGKQQTDISYDVHLKLKAFEALVDLYPGKRGVFHVTAGLLSNPLTVSGDGQPSGTGTFTINDHTYTAAQVGTLTASAKWPSASPYLGVGFGSPARRGGRISFLFDLGAAIGKAKLSLASTGAASNATLQADLDAQRAKTQKDVDKIPVYPVISLGLAFHF